MIKLITLYEERIDDNNCVELNLTRYCKYDGNSYV